MWTADKLVYRGEDDFIRAYQGSELVWERPLSNNKIYYTSTDGNIVVPYASTHFGDAVIVSNTYSGGQGVIEFDRNLTYIGRFVFGDCSSLVSITIPDGVTNIDAGAFDDCTGLASIVIPSSVTSIGTAAFSGCSSLVSITIPDGITSISSQLFDHCSSLVSITIPDGVTEIGEDAFMYCTSLTSITIPDSVTRIDSGAFKYCTGLTSITIPNSVTEIRHSAFYRCSRLSEVIVNAVVPPNMTKNNQDIYDQFDYNASGRKIKVPAASLQAYKTATGWSTYAADIIAQ